LKAEFMFGEAMAGLCAAAGVDDGMERSKRSPMPELGAAAGLGAVAGVELVIELKSPKPLEELKVRCFWSGLVAGGDFGVLSKKLPPPPNADGAVFWGVERCVEKLARLENADGLGCC